MITNHIQLATNKLYAHNSISHQQIENTHIE